MIARIIKIISKNYTLLDDEGNRYEALVMGKVRLQETPLTGDLVEADLIDGKYAIQKILPRRNRLYRPSVANVDQALIVMSIKDPDFSAVLVDRLSFLIANEDIEPVLIVTKTDLGISPETEKLIREYEEGPMKVIRTAKDTANEEILPLLENKISVLTGQSGAGKSTLLNTIEPSFHLATQEISKALGRGKHTTRHNELHQVGSGLVADTPGFSSISFDRMSVSDLAQSVIEFRPYLGHCQFNDCVHQNEPNCRVKEAIEAGKIPRTRYDNYISVLKMIQSRREKYL